MAKQRAERAGPGPCPQCGKSVVFKVSAGGFLRYQCDHCITSGYAEPGGPGYAKWSAGIERQAPAATTAPAAPAPAPAKPRAPSFLDSLS